MDFTSPGSAAAPLPAVAVRTAGGSTGNLPGLSAGSTFRTTSGIPVTSSTTRHIFNTTPPHHVAPPRTVPFKYQSSAPVDIPSRNGLSAAIRPGDFSSRIPRSRFQLSRSAPSSSHPHLSSHFSSVNNRMSDEIEIPDTLTSGRRSRSKSRDRSRSRSRQMSRESRGSREQSLQRNRTKEEIYQMAVRPVNKTPTPDFATLRLMAMNLSGRFTAKELKALGQQVLRLLLMEKDIDLFFGQQTVFRPSLPDHFELVGTNKAFLTYDRRIFKVVDERHYRHFLRDLQQVGRIPYHYLPEQNYVVLKMTLRHIPGVHFLALSWVTDQCHGQVRATSIFRKLMGFAANLSALEEIPIIVGGTFNLSPEEAVDSLPDGFVCHGYDPHNKRRIARASNFFLASEELMMRDVKPLSCAHMDLDLPPDKVWSPEDAFYNDPVLTSVVLRETDAMFTSGRYNPSTPGSPSSGPGTPVITSSLATQLSYSKPFPDVANHLDENKNIDGAAVKQNGTGNDQGSKDAQAQKHPYKHLYDEDLIENAPTCYMS